MNNSQIQQFAEKYRENLKTSVRGRNRLETLQLEVSEPQKEAVRAYFNEDYETVSDIPSGITEKTGYSNVKSAVVQACIKLVYQNREKLGI